MLSKIDWWRVGGVCILVAGAWFYFQEPKESKERLKLAVKKTSVISSVSTFMSDLQSRKCWIVGGWVFGAMELSDTDKLICMVSSDEKEVKPLVFPKERLP